MTPNLQPLPSDIIEESVHFQYKWSDAPDIHAEPWLM